MEKQKTLNHLAAEKSPYLIQHSHNPVYWYPWGDEAFEKARLLDKPIFLSIGYSTCHWCHVMEKESFENEIVARMINEHFIAIKVDREERPDIDNIYMAICQMLTGSGGWPLTIVMTPEKRPFYAATYLPKESRYGMIGLVELIPRIAAIWQSRRDEVVESSKQITNALSQVSVSHGDGGLSESIFREVFGEFENRFDPRFGGFGHAPKFPTPHNFMFLLRYWKRTGETKALDMVVKSLESMRSGGIYDQIGFGYHRYSTDPEWLVPHFEKMLYDQALMAIANIEAFQATKKEIFKQTAEEIFEYVLRDMTSPDGGFYSAEDADSEGIEGKFYTWREKEIREILSPDDFDFASKVLDISEKGNFESHEDTSGLNIFRLKKTVSRLAKEIGISETDFRLRFNSIRKKIFELRDNRIHPFKDDKILTDWNGLMIAALALGAQVFDNESYKLASVRAAELILRKLRDNEGGLLHRYRDGETAIKGMLDDYAFLIWGLLNLYEATYEERFIEAAASLTEKQISGFWDQKSGGFFFTYNSDTLLQIRKKEFYDGASPSGNSVSALNLIRLGKITGKTTYTDLATKIFAINAMQVKENPQAFTMLLSAFYFAQGPSIEIIIVGPESAVEINSLLNAIHERYFPNKIILLFKPGNCVSIIENSLDYTQINGKVTIYICKNRACNLPYNDIDKALLYLDSIIG